jgi:hypothetical protein
MKINLNYTVITGVLLFVVCCVCACYAQRVRKAPVPPPPIKVEEKQKAPLIEKKLTEPFEVHIIEHGGKEYIVVNNSTSISIAPVIQ